jgi:GNAT superfamily N-acetyltransferase
MSANADPFTCQTLRDLPDLAERFYPQKQRIWAEFMLHDVYSNRLWHHLLEDFPEFQLYLLNEENAPVAVGQSMPLYWDGTMKGLPVGWADSMVRGVDGLQGGVTPNTLAALEISIQPEYHGQGISYRMIKLLREKAHEHGFQAVIVAVRPSWKDRYPLTPMERYVRWQQADGTPFDPWLRAHWRSGGEILKTAHPSMVIEGSADEWEEWTGMKFPESGDYVVAGALAPIQIDRTMNIGRYVEPNVWVHHPLTTARLLPAEEQT